MTFSLILKSVNKLRNNSNQPNQHTTNLSKSTFDRICEFSTQSASFVYDSISNIAIILVILSKESLVDQKTHVLCHLAFKYPKLLAIATNQTRITNLSTEVGPTTIDIFILNGIIGERDENDH